MSSPAADRNLLFGIIALQMDFVTRDALIAAMNAWVLDKARSLGQILVQQGALSEEDRGLLDPLVRKHLAKHGNDAERSLSALSPVGWIKHDLQAVADPELDVSLGRLAEAGTDPDATRTYAVGASSAQAGRFRILRPHARGGQGEVYVACDTELNREVALKQLQAHHAHLDESRARFVMEAELTGGLEHPGVVPVYGLGHYDDGRPFYAMRLIKGDSLKEAIERFHAAEGAGRDPGERTMALRRLLGRFVDVCNAIAYAHSRGVLHRDLKPGNIMLGPYGETLVVDWGLAKAVGRGEVPAATAEETLRPPASSETPPTVMGEAIGTAAYMSPEQAAGRLDELGPASDVYSLGATLYCLLTGQAPFSDQDRGLVLRKVQRGDFPPPRRLKPEVPHALEAVCLKAMAPAPSARYVSPRALADDVEHWLADEPVSALREPWIVHSRRWMRRHRTLVTTAAATVLVSLVALGIGYAHVSVINRRLDVANRQVTSANLQLKAANAELQEANAHVTRSKAESDRRLDQTLKAIEDYYTGVSQEILLKQTEFQALRKRLLEKPRQFYEQLAKELEANPSPDERTRSLLAKGRLGLGRISQTLGRNDEAKTHYQAALALYRELAAAQPEVAAHRDGLVASLNNLGNSLRDTGEHRRAADAYREAQDVLTKLAVEPSNRPARLLELSNIHNNLGIVLENRGELGAAAEVIREGVKILSQLIAEHPEVPEYRHRLANDYNSLSNVLREKGDYPRAAESIGKAIDLETKLVSDHPESVDYQLGLAQAHGSLGLVFDEMGNYRAAADEHRRTIDVHAKLVAAHPNVPLYQHGQAIGSNNLGRVLMELNDLAGAAEAFRSGIALRSRLASRYPDVPDYWRGLANKTTNLGVVLRRMGDLDGAVAAFREAIKSWDRLASDHPDVPDYQTGLARAYNNLGTAQYPAKDYPGAADSYRKAAAIQAKLVSAHPSTVEFPHALGLSLHNLAEVSRELGRPEEALRFSREAIAMQRKALDLAPQTARVRQALDGDYLALAAVLRTTGRVDEALATAQERRSVAADAKVGLYNFACDLALCAAIARDAAQRQAMATAAVDALRSAIAAGFHDAAHASRDPDLATLRDRDDVRQLLADLWDRTFPADPFVP